MTEPSGPQPGEPAKKKSIWLRVALGLGVALVVLLIAAFIAGEVLIHRAQPMLKAKVVETLSNRFDSRVELDRFHVSLVEGLSVTGSGLSLYPNRLQAAEPMIAVKDFSFHATWKQLFATPTRVGKVNLTGLAVHLPPKSQRSSMPHLSSSSSSSSGGGFKIQIGEIDCDQTTLVMGTDKPNKVPLEFDIHHLQLWSVGPGQPMKFHAILVNPKPVGDIDSSGYFGPFVADSPADTPVSGDYSFTNADLGTLKGIGGTLSSTGRYQGTLDSIVVDGKTSTPDFKLDIASHPVPLNTTFHAIVDGTNGDTHLEPVDAWLLHSHIVAKGDVVRNANVKGHDIRLDVKLDPALIQDVLELGAKADKPLLNGSLTMHTSFHLPPGKESVIDKLNLAGSFAIENAHFTSEKFQSKVDELSLRGQGKAKEAKQESDALKKDAAPPPATDSAAGSSQPAKPASSSSAGASDPISAEANVASDIRGDFVFSGGKIELKQMQYRVPGADIDIDGSYTLKGGALDFQGSARLDAKISQLVTGWKSLLLKPIDPFFAKHGAGTFVPIKVGGTRSDPHIGLDFGHKQAAPPPAPSSANAQPDAAGKP